MAQHYDVVVIGSGFGGSVAALRLTEKGYRVGVLEAGRRWRPEDFPKTNWRLRDSISAPRLGLTGTQAAVPIWARFMEVAHRGKPVRDFQAPPGVIDVWIDADTGYRAGADCPHSKRQPRRS